MKEEKQPTQADKTAICQDPVLALAVQRRADTEDHVGLTRSMSQVASISRVILMHTDDTENAFILSQLEYRMRKFCGIPAEDIAKEDNEVTRSGDWVAADENTYEKGWFPYRMKYLQKHVFPHMADRGIRRRIGILKEQGWVLVKGSHAKTMQIRVNIRRLQELNSVYGTVMKFWEDAGLKSTGELRNQKEKPAVEKKETVEKYHENSDVSTTNNDSDVVKNMLKQVCSDLSLRTSPGFWESFFVTDISNITELAFGMAAKSGAKGKSVKSLAAKSGAKENFLAAKSGAKTSLGGQKWRQQYRRSILRRILGVEEKEKTPYIPLGEGDFIFSYLSDREDQWKKISQDSPPRMDPEEFIRLLPGKEYLKLIHPDFGKPDFYCPELYRSVARQIRKGAITFPMLFQMARVGLDGREKFFKKTTWQETWKHAKKDSTQEQLAQHTEQITRILGQAEIKAGAVLESELDESLIHSVGLRAAAEIARIQRPGHRELQARLIESRRDLSREIRIKPEDNLKDHLAAVSVSTSVSRLNFDVLGKAYELDPEIAIKSAEMFRELALEEVQTDYDIFKFVQDDWSEEKLEALLGISREELRQHWSCYRGRLTLMRELFPEANMAESTLAELACAK